MDCEPDEMGDGHIWKWVPDWMGDPGVINGTVDCSHYECVICGEEKDGDPPADEDDDYELGDNSWVVNTLP
mgnify:CR=1 FL=1